MIAAELGRRAGLAFHKEASAKWRTVQGLGSMMRRFMPSGMVTSTSTGDTVPRLWGLGVAKDILGLGTRHAGLEKRIGTLPTSTLRTSDVVDKVMGGSAPDRIFRGFTHKNPLASQYSGTVGHGSPLPGVAGTYGLPVGERKLIGSWSPLPGQKYSPDFGLEKNIPGIDPTQLAVQSVREANRKMFSSLGSPASRATKLEQLARQNVQSGLYETPITAAHPRLGTHFYDPVTSQLSNVPATRDWSNILRSILQPIR